MAETTGKPGPRAVDSPAEVPTLESTWRATAGSPISDKLLEWPADLFALTDVLLGRSEVYRFVLSPNCDLKWPPSRFHDWSGEVEEAGRQWSAWAEDGRGPVPLLLAEEWSAFRERAGMPLERLAEGRDWRMCEALLTLHAIADEACAGLFAALDRSDGRGCLYRARGRELLAQTGSLARIPTHLLRVLPKVRTPPTGTSVRSLSRYACVQGPDVETRWFKVPAGRTGTDPRSRHANLLLLPWPLRVRESDFRPLQMPVQRLAKEPFGFYEFVPSEKLDLELVSRMITTAMDEVDSVDVVVLPESAVDESDINDLEALLDRHGVVSLITGVRQRSEQPGCSSGNWVHIGISPILEKGKAPPTSTGEEWFHIRQQKHHPWSLDEAQIYQYHLGGALHPHVRWWEAIEVPRRAIQFVELGDGITLASLVCEDLAEIDEVADVLRSVGPTAVFTPLLDGPQLTSRWSARYASVLADDPGSAVLTLTSFGMVERCRPHGRNSSTVIGLWKDPVRGFREIPLESGAQGVILTVCGDRATRRTYDGRWPVDNATEYFDVAVCQIRASNPTVKAFNSPLERLGPPVLETDEVTILTSWAEALIEALAHAPEYVESLLANAKVGAPWRAALHLTEPSHRLREAIGFMERAVKAVTAEGPPTLQALQMWCGEDRKEALGLEMLVRRVLRSTLEQALTRQIHETGRPNDIGRLRDDEQRPGKAFIRA